MTEHEFEVLNGVSRRIGRVTDRLRSGDITAMEAVSHLSSISEDVYQLTIHASSKGELT